MESEQHSTDIVEHVDRYESSHGQASERDADESLFVEAQYGRNKDFPECTKADQREEIFRKA